MSLESWRLLSPIVINRPTPRPSRSAGNYTFGVTDLAIPATGYVGYASVWAFTSSSLSSFEPGTAVLERVNIRNGSVSELYRFKLNGKSHYQPGVSQWTVAIAPNGPWLMQVNQHYIAIINIAEQHNLTPNFSVSRRSLAIAQIAAPGYGSPMALDRRVASVLVPTNQFGAKGVSKGGIAAISTAPPYTVHYINTINPPLLTTYGYPEAIGVGVSGSVYVLSNISHLAMYHPVRQRNGVLLQLPPYPVQSVDGVVIRYRMVAGQLMFAGYSSLPGAVTSTLSAISPQTRFPHARGSSGFDLAIDPSGGAVVASYAGGVIVRYELPQLLGTVLARPANPLTTGKKASRDKSLGGGGLMYSPSGRFLFYQSIDMKSLSGNRLLVLNPMTLQTERVLPLCRVPGEMAINDASGAG